MTYCKGLEGPKAKGRALRTMNLLCTRHSRDGCPLAGGGIQTFAFRGFRTIMTKHNLDFWIPPARKILCFVSSIGRLFLRIRLINPLWIVVAAVVD